MTIQRFSIGVAVGVFACVAAASTAQAQTQAPAARKLDISFNNGLVTLVAENVTIRDILAEWGRKGGSRIVNAEKLTGPAVPFLEFRDEPEVVVLRSLLRDAPGYGAAPRVAPGPEASTIEALFILASRSVPVSNAPASSAVQQFQSAPQRQIMAAEEFQPTPPSNPTPRVIDGSPDAQIPPVQPVQGDLPPSASAPQPVNPNLRVGPGGTITSTVPGVVIGGTPATPPGRGGTPPPAGGRGGGGGSLR